MTFRLFDFYIKRKKFTLDQLDYELKFLGNKKRFLQEIMNGDIKLFEENGKTKVLANLLLKNTMTRFKKQLPEYEAKCKEYTDMMIQNRDDIVKNVFKNKDGSVVNCPVAFMHIINNVQGQQNINSSSIVDITPLEAFDLIENCYANLEKIRCAVPTRLFKTLFYFYLSPKELLYVKRFNCAALKILLDTISLTYKRAIVNPGEMVGMIAAQSIGEPTTQMTLNSVTYETEIIVRDHAGQITKHQIGDFIENKIKKISLIETTCDEMEYQFVNKSFLTGTPHEDLPKSFTFIIFLHPCPKKSSGIELYKKFNEFPSTKIINLNYLNEMLKAFN